LQRTAQIAVVDGADLCAFELKDLLTSGFWHGTPPGVRWREERPEEILHPT
jgi:hypothetical protein